MMQRRSSHLRVIFADDLTGANDAGVQFAHVGLRTRVSFDASQAAARDANNILVIDTDSRACNAAAAYQRVYAAARVFAQRSIPVLYKKLDSTLRGALGAELDAVMDAYATQLVVLSPAFPAQQRTLLEGTLHLAGAPATPSHSAADPQRAARESHLPTLLAGQTRRAVHALGLDAIAAGAPQVAARLQWLRVAEGAIVVCDAATDAHLAVIVEATLMLGEGCLLAGSAGLARPLAAHMAAQIDEAYPGGRMETSASRGHARVLVVIGSRHPIIRAQLNELVRQHAAHVITLDPAAASDTAAWDAWLAHALQRIDRVARAAPIVLTTPALAVSTNRSATLLPRLAELATAVMQRVPIDAVVATGGATVRALSNAWEAAGIDLIDEIAPGIALGVVSGGQYDGLTLVTKAGGFGDAATLAALVHHLHTRREASSR